MEADFEGTEAPNLPVHLFVRQLRPGEIEFARSDPKRQHSPSASYSGGERARHCERDFRGRRSSELEPILQRERNIKVVFGEFAGCDQVFPKTLSGGLGSERTVKLHG